MSDEKEEAYISLYNELKINYKFIRTIITTDFEMSNIKAIRNIFNNENVKIIKSHKDLQDKIFEIFF